jgi:hypothetical protein
LRRCYYFLLSEATLGTLCTIALDLRLGVGKARLDFRKFALALHFTLHIIAHLLAPRNKISAWDGVRMCMTR